MDKEDQNLMMVVFIQENGKIIKCMDMVNYIIKMDKLPIKAIGTMINSMDLEEFLMIGLRNCWEDLIILILLIQVINGYTIKVILKVILNMEKVRLD